VRVGGGPASVDAVELGPVGVWWSGSWEVPGQPELNVPAQLEALGYSAIWSSGGLRPGLSSRFSRLLDATGHMIVASGIVSIWRSPPAAIARAAADLDARHPGRFLLGLGASHAALVEEYHHPRSKMVEYLDALDACDPTAPKERRVLAALGPRMLELAAERAAGAHPYFVPAEHTARAREVMGQGPLLAPEVTVVLEADPAKARQLARGFARGYLELPNYAHNLRRLGYSEEDLAGGGSDRLIDSIVAWGDAAALARRVREHHEAGADQVCVQMVTGDEGFPIGEYSQLAAAVVGG
jgi:probable F420-dependent oxidoreductase